MNRKVLLPALLVAVSFNVHAEETSLKFTAPLVAGAILLIRPVVHLLQKTAGYGIGSVVGMQTEVKDNKKEVKCNLGALDVKVKMPVAADEVVKKKSMKKRSIQDIFDDYVNPFLPSIEMAIADKNSPLVVDRIEAESFVEKRLYFTVSLGDWSARFACSMQEIGMLAAALVALVATSGTNSDSPPASSCPNIKIV